MTYAKTHGLALAALAASTLVAGSAMAQETTLSYNGGAISEYRYRGVSQSNLKPAVQGGLDYAHKSGFYVGAWASSIKWLRESNLELDVYGGYKGELRPGLAYDAGVLRYQYLDSAFANTTEVYGALTYGMFTAKYSRSTTNLFGTDNSKGSGYLDLSASIDLGNGLSLVPHVGRQLVKNNGAASYTDYALTLNKDLGQGLSASLAYIDLNKELKASFTEPDKDMGKARLVAGIKYTF
jgi:uncharacterized protein (TIGR02001 family)